MAEAELHIIGWRVGLPKVRLTHLLHRELGMAMIEAKGVVDEVLRRSDFDALNSYAEESADRVLLTSPVVVRIPGSTDLGALKKTLREMGLIIPGNR
jgi:hypothetical protein